jgi:hypothetical protein
MVRLWGRRVAARQHTPRQRKKMRLSRGVSTWLAAGGDGSLTMCHLSQLNVQPGPKTKREKTLEEVLHSKILQSNNIRCCTFNTFKKLTSIYLKLDRCLFASCIFYLFGKLRI